MFKDDINATLLRESNQGKLQIYCIINKLVSRESAPFLNKVDYWKSPTKF
jgi:hypothetical protein